jgi:hypothetical protein
LSHTTEREAIATLRERAAFSSMDTTVRLLWQMFISIGERN